MGAGRSSPRGTTVFGTLPVNDAEATARDARAARRPPLGSRYGQVVRVLWRVLVLNLAVAFAKIAFGYSSGAISILSDGFHSLTDAASNIVGIVGVRAASRHPRNALGNA